jgi:septum formation protein
MELALGKAECLRNEVKGIIIGIDNVVVIDDKIIEKPKSIDEARSNLVKSSNNVSKVISGLAIIDTINDKIINTYQETLVYMNEISEDDIDYYIDNEDGVMYAAGFIIENIASNFINKIEGSYYNILGVPVEKIYEILKEWGYSLKDINES